jgi:hypothetical protein
LWLVLSLALILYISLWAYDRKFRLDPSAPAYGSDRFHGPHGETEMHSERLPLPDNVEVLAVPFVEPFPGSRPAEPVDAPSLANAHTLSYLHRHLGEPGSQEAPLLTPQMRSDRIKTGVLSRLGRMLIGRRPIVKEREEPSCRPDAEFEGKLAHIRPIFQNTHSVYERRINELEGDLATKAEINRELIRAKIQLIQQTMEMDTRRT